MHTSKSLHTSSPTFSSIRQRSLGRVVSVGVLVSALVTGCSHSWDDYDPRIKAGAGGTGGLGGSGGSPVGSGGSGGSPVEEKCGGTSVLVSDFSGSGVTDLWNGNTWGGGNIGEANGELVLDFSTDGSASGAYLLSEFFYDFRGDFASIEVNATPGVGKAAEAFFAVGPDEQNYVEIYQKEDMLNFGYERSGMYNKIKSILYEPSMHHFWQLRELNGVVIYETSPDGQTWTNHLEMPQAALFPLDYSRILVGGNGEAGAMGPKQARFDKLSGGGTSKQNYCPMHSFADDFNDGMRGNEWLRAWEAQPGMLAEEAGQFVLHYVPNMEAYAGLVSARAFDLTNSSMIIEVTATPQMQQQAHVGIDLNGPGDNDVEMFMEEGYLKFGVENFGNFKELGTIAYSADQHRWWRIREASNTLFWETAPDGKTWTTQLQVSPLPVPVNILDVEIHGGTWTSQPTPGDVRADNLNLPPP